MPADFKQAVNLAGKILASGQIPGSFLLSFTGSPTGGTFTVTVTVNGVPVATSAQTYSGSYTAAALQTALQGLSNVGASNATVTGSNGGPFTITFAAIGAVTVSVTNVLTGGTAPNALITTPTATTIYTVPGASAIKLATAVLTNISASPVTVSVSAVPSGGSVDGTHLVVPSFTINANDSTKLTEIEGGMFDAGAFFAVNPSAANAINYLLTGAVSS